MKNNYQEEFETYQMSPDSDNEQTSSTEEKPKEPSPSTESSGEVIKPGGKKEKNPKKM